MFHSMIIANWLSLMKENQLNTLYIYMSININNGTKQTTTLIYFCLFLFVSRFKNGQPYPWDSSLILYPKAENQTIYKRNVTTNDNGNYTCVIQNDTVKIVRVIQLTVEGKI